MDGKHEILFLSLSYDSHARRIRVIPVLFSLSLFSLLSRRTNVILSTVPPVYVQLVTGLTVDLR